MSGHSIAGIYSLFPLTVGDKVLKMLSVDKLDEYCKLLRSKEFNKNLVRKISENFTHKELYKILFERVTQYKQNNDSGEYRAILTDRTNKIYGSITMYFYDDSVELGYYVVPECRRKGYATAMVKEFIGCMPLGEWGIKCIFARVIADNKASVRLLVNIGFKEIGTDSENEGTEVLVLRKGV